MTNHELRAGLSIHCHHDILLEYCYDFQARVNAIRQTKPAGEQEIRLRLFKLLSQEAINDLPPELIRTDDEWNRARAEWNRVNAELIRTDAVWRRAYAEWEEKDKWHKKWCNCDEWNGKEIVFKKRSEKDCQRHESRLKVR